MKAETLQHILSILHPGQPITTRQFSDKCDTDLERARKWLDELVVAGLVRKEEIRYPGLKHQRKLPVKYQYVLAWRPI